MAAAGLAATATACSHAAPAPVTPKDAGNTRPSGQQAGAGHPAGTATHHSSEAEPKSASPTPAAPAPPAGPAAPAALTPPPAAGQAGAAPAASPGAVVPLPPIVTTSAAETGAAAGAGAAPAGTASGPAKAAATPAATPQAPVVSVPAAAAAPVPPPGSAASPATSRVPAGTTPAASNPSVIVVDTADYDPDSQLTLAEAAKAERERKAETSPPRIVINNKTIHRYAKGGQLTVAEPKKKAAPPQPAQAAGPTSAATATTATTATSPAVPLQRDERYWRGRALEIRQRWRKASDRIKELEDDIALLRRRFYAQDDPYVRDGQIKPAWDRALDELRESRATVQAAKKELTDFLDEGRIAGALPGWLREGVDLEPKEEKPVDPTQPIETPIYKDHGR
jgi:hypothetical protein